DRPTVDTGPRDEGSIFGTGQLPRAHEIEPLVFHHRLGCLPPRTRCAADEHQAQARPRHDVFDCHEFHASSRPPLRRRRRAPAFDYAMALAPWRTPATGLSCAACLAPDRRTVRYAPRRRAVVW